MDELERREGIVVVYRKIIILNNKTFNSLDDFQMEYLTIWDGEDAYPGERVRQEIISEVPATPYKGRGQAGANGKQRDKGTMARLREGRDIRRSRKRHSCDLAYNV